MESTSSNFPMLAQAEQTVTLSHADGFTQVVNTVTYHLKYGWLGQLIDPPMFRPIVRSAAGGFVGSLAKEAQQPGTG